MWWAWLIARRRYFISDDKLKSLGWTESTTWEDGLKRTIDWCVPETCC